MDVDGSAADAETGGAAPVVSQHALQLQMAFRKVDAPGSRWNGAYSGSQGMAVADFVQHGCGDVSISRAGWRFTSTGGNANQIKAQFSTLFGTEVDSSRVPSARGDSSKRHISDKVLPKNYTALAEAELRANGITMYSAKDPVVRSVELACIGGDKHGKNGGSGSNCARVPARPGWCNSATGSCPPNCTFLSSRSKEKNKDKNEHMCEARLYLIWTLCSAVHGVVLVKLGGFHFPDGTVWVPPSDAAAGTTDSAKALLEQGTAMREVPAATRQKMALVSPSAETNKRRVPDQKQISKYQRDRHYYKGGSVRYGDVTQWDGIVRDAILGRNTPRANSGGEAPIMLYYEGTEHNNHSAISTPRNLEWAMTARFCRPCCGCLACSDQALSAEGIAGAG
jgi:hypothetical protein